MTLEARIAELQPSAEQAEAKQQLGVGQLDMTLAPITPELRKEYSLDSDVSGAAVVDVAPDGPAAKAGFEPGDVITRAGQQTVGNPGDVANVVDQARKSGKDHVILLRRRDGQSLFVPLPLG